MHAKVLLPYITVEGFSHTVPLSNIHSGNTCPEEPVQAPYWVHWCYLAYAQTALNADAMLKFRPHAYDKGLLPIYYCGLGNVLNNVSSENKTLI